MSTATEWYVRGALWMAMDVHVSVAGSHSSAHTDTLYVQHGQTQPDTQVTSFEFKHAAPLHAALATCTSQLRRGNTSLARAAAYEVDLRCEVSSCAPGTKTASVSVKGIGKGCPPTVNTLPSGSATETPKPRVYFMGATLRDVTAWLEAPRVTTCAVFSESTPSYDGAPARGPHPVSGKA